MDDTARITSDTRPFLSADQRQYPAVGCQRAISEHEKLPSVREMASTLAINPNTIQRAYRELENEGYIYTIPGKGTFVSENQLHQSEPPERTAGKVR